MVGTPQQFEPAYAVVRIFRRGALRSMTSERLRFAVDTGGTFTDLIVADERGTMQLFKSSTTPSDPAAGIVNVLKVAADAAGQPLDQYLKRGDFLVHGTTHAINAIITGNTARTAFLTTEGHPDTLVFREGGRLEAFNFTIAYPEPYVPKALTFEIPERIRADGVVHKPLDEAAAVAVLERVKEAGAEAIAISLLWSVVNPAHELALADLVSKHLPGIPVTLSHQINPSVREYRRSMSTALDASLKPVMGAYMRGLEHRVCEAGFEGRLLVVTSQGGVVDAADAAQAPVHLINSGPCMAPVAAHAYGNNFPTLIVGDTGGTTFDVSLVRDGRVPRTRETWLGLPFSSHLTGVPSVDIKSVGAGGGSIAWVDAGGLLHVGPISAGAVPGPAAYGQGGTRPTVTDAAIVLGIIDADFFLGGRMKLDRQASVDAIHRDVAMPLGITVEDAADAIMELATEHMVQAIMGITVNQGIDPTDAAFVAGGGAAGLNCVGIGKRLGCHTVLVPEAGAALSAVGALISDLKAHYQQVFHVDSEEFDAAGVNAVLEQLQMRCRAFAETTGVPASSVTIDWVAEARYRDQAWEIEVPLRKGRFEAEDDVAALVADFHRTHQEIFAVSDVGAPVEVVGWAATVQCRIGADEPGRLGKDSGQTAERRRRIYMRQHGWMDAPAVGFDAFDGGKEIAGPAVIESDFTSVFIEPGTRARRGELGTIVVDMQVGA